MIGKSRSGNEEDRDKVFNFIFPLLARQNLHRPSEQEYSFGMARPSPAKRDSRNVAFCPIDHRVAATPPIRRQS